MKKRQGSLVPKLITHRFKLTESNETFAALEAGEVGRALVSMPGFAP